MPLLPFAADAEASAPEGGPFERRQRRGSASEDGGSGAAPVRRTWSPRSLGIEEEAPGGNAWLNWLRQAGPVKVDHGVGRLGPSVHMMETRRGL